MLIGDVPPNDALRYFLGTAILFTSVTGMVFNFGFVVSAPVFFALVTFASIDPHPFGRYWGTGTLEELAWSSLAAVLGIFIGAAIDRHYRQRNRAGGAGETGGGELNDDHKM